MPFPPPWPPVSDHAPSRRHFLRASAAGVLGLSLPQLLAAQSQAPGQRPRRARNVLVILEQGGLSHIDTWDPKPDVVAEHRSPYRPIATKVPGLRFTELLARTAGVADKLAVVRSMHHDRGGANGHPDGTQYILSGAHPGAPLTMPDIGSVVSHLLGSPCRYLPPYVMVPGNDEQASSTRHGFLPAATKVFKTGGRDVSARDWKVGALAPLPDNAGPRLADRRHLLAGIDGRDGAVPADRPALGGMDRFYEQAFDMVSSPRVARTFDLQTEPAAVRERVRVGPSGGVLPGRAEADRGGSPLRHHRRALAADGPRRLAASTSTGTTTT